MNFLLVFTTVEAAYDDAEIMVEVGSGSTHSPEAAEFQIGKNLTKTLSTLAEEIMVEDFEEPDESYSDFSIGTSPIH
jgi:hypothetical protein